MAEVNGKNIFFTGIKGETGEIALTCNVPEIGTSGAFDTSKVWSLRNEYFNRVPIVGDIFNCLIDWDGIDYLATCQVTDILTENLDFENWKIYFTVRSRVRVTGATGPTGPTGAKLISQVFQGSDDNGGNIYLQTFDDGTTATFTAPTGDEVGPWIDVAYGGESEPIEYGAVYEVSFENVDLFHVCFMDNGEALTTMSCKRNEFTRIQKGYTENWVEGDPDGNWDIFNSYQTVVLNKDTMKMHLDSTICELYITTDGAHVGGVPKYYYNQPFKYRRIR